MTWLIISIFAYFLNALAGLIDKILLKKSIPEPVVYTFYVGVLSLIALVLIPWGFQYPGLNLLLTSLLAGFIFIFALWLLYTLLKKEEVSRIIPLVGGFSSVFVFLSASLFSLERLSSRQILAFIIILIGGFLISLKGKELKKILSKKIFFLGLLDSSLFALFYLLSKYVYLHHPFISSFVWLRIGGGLGVLILFLIPKNREKILAALKKPATRINKLFLFGKGCGGLSAFFVNYAIAIGSVSLVNALQGSQYGFLFLMAVIFSKKFPLLLEEELTLKIVFQKVVSIILIILGIFLLFLNI